MNVTVRAPAAAGGGRGKVVGLLRHFLVVYPRRSIVIVVLLTIAGLAEGVSLVALLPFVEYATTGAGNESTTGRWISGALGLLGLTPTVGTMLVLIVGGIALKAGITLLAMKEAGYAVGSLMTDLRHRLVAGLMSARWGYFVSQPLGLFSNAIGAETIRAGQTYQQSARFLAVCIQALIYGLVTLLVSWRIAVFAIVAGAGGALLFRKVMVLAFDAGGRQTDLLRQLSTRVTDALQGMKAIKAMGAENRALPLLDREINALDAAQRQQVWSAELLRTTQEPILVSVLAAGIYGAVTLGGQPLSALMVVTVLFYRLFNRFQIAQEIFQQIASGASAYWAMHDLAADVERAGEGAKGGVAAPATAPRIELRGVTYAYAAAPVLSGVSLDIAPGEFITISGASGGGKTTLVDIVCGLLRPASGGLFVDGRNLREIDLASWRARIGYVPQEMLLLHDSVLRNVSLGDDRITRADAENALKAAGIWDLIASLPEGLDTLVGERGGRFSGGQRQRISLARALVRRPTVLLLDEITAALDKDTERAVCETLRGLAGRITIIAVSHQAEMARVANRTFRMDSGTIAALSDTI